jgi:hypothetical protein
MKDYFDINCVVLLYYWPDIKGNPFVMKWKMRIGFWNVRTLREYGKLKQVEKEMRPKRTWRRTIEDEIRNTERSWNEVKGIAGDCNAWKLFMDALCSTRSKRK